MANGTPSPIDRTAAIDELGTWLGATVDGKALTSAELAAWPGHGFSHGWRLPGLVVAGEEITLDLLIDKSFPWTRPRIGWVNAPPFPSIPHVESDNLLCVFSATDEINPRRPVPVAKSVLAGAGDIFEAGLTGANQSHFRDEFQSYWFKDARGPEWTSLCDPSGPSREISIWSRGRAVIIADNPEALCAWLKNKYRLSIEPRRVRRALLLWLHEPLLPAEYPLTADDLYRFATRAHASDKLLLDALLRRGAKDSMVVLGARAGESVTFAGITIRRQRPDGFRKRFGHRRLPPQVMLADVARAPVERSRVERADGLWVHGRDSNQSVSELGRATIALLGCGSLGSPVARLLAQAGVGKLLLIDPELLTYANTGRHVLGSGSVNRSKAHALRTRLVSDFPHLTVAHVTAGWQSIRDTRPDLLTECSLLVSTIGSWRHEGELNEWHLANGPIPPILYGWSEPFGAGGQAVTIGQGSGCLACGMEFLGKPRLKVAEFDGPILRREAACGVYFQPYGAAEIEAIAVMVATLAVDTVLSRAGPGAHRLLAAPLAHVERASGRFTAPWIALSGGRTRGANQEHTAWQPHTGCPMCGGQGL